MIGTHKIPISTLFSVQLRALGMSTLLCGRHHLHLQSFLLSLESTKPKPQTSPGTLLIATSVVWQLEGLLEGEHVTFFLTQLDNSWYLSVPF